MSRMLATQGLLCPQSRARNYFFFQETTGQMKSMRTKELCRMGAQFTKPKAYNMFLLI